MEFDATFLIAAISFILFVLIMNKIFYAPVFKIMQLRNQTVEDNYSKAEIIKKEVKKQEEYHSSSLDTVRTEARGVLDAAIQRVNSEKSKIISDYKTELGKNAVLEKENLINSAYAAEEVLKDNTAEIAKDISGILLGSEIDCGRIDKQMINIKDENA